MRGHNPDWANLPRRKCDDCGKSYKPKQPLREGTRGFCSDNCRKSYHKHGGAYRKLKVEMVKMVERRIEELRVTIREIVRQEIRSIVTAASAGHPGSINERRLLAEVINQSLSPSPAAQRANR
jgi:hypothetical protein